MSRTGGGTLRGWSKLQNPTSGDLNHRKGTKVVWTPGHVSPHIFAYIRTGGAACDGTIIESEIYTAISTIAQWNVSTNSATSTFERGEDYDPCSIGLNDTTFAPNLAGSDLGAFVNLLGLGAAVSGTISYPQDWAITIAYDAYAGACIAASGECGGGDRKHFLPYDAFEDKAVYTEFDSVAAALARASPTLGTLCKTRGGTISGGGTIGSQGQTTLGSATVAVTATISMTGLTATVAYTITANINRYTAGGGAFVDTIQVEIDFTADGSSDTVDYEVPVNTDFDYEFASIVSVLPA